MSEYIQYNIKTSNKELQEILIAQLSNLNINGFEEDDGQLIMFAKNSEEDILEIEETLDELNADYSKEYIEEQNWNTLWEANFQPLLINNLIGIRAHFHEPLQNVKHELVITPKMSFGTGHHATTFMMMQQMAELNFEEKEVFDFGTGTGVLAILAEQLGAKKIIATDIDDWSIENANENVQRNNCTKIVIIKTGLLLQAKQLDIILANINKNVLLQTTKKLSVMLKSEGYLLMSGILKEDETVILNEASKNNLSQIKTVNRGHWICILLKKI